MSVGRQVNGQATIGQTNATAAGYGIVAFSHLRWSFVWQRPQQLLSRLSRWHPIIYVEEPIWDLESGSEPWLDIQQVAAKVKTATPHLSAHKPVESYHEDMLRLILDVTSKDPAFTKPLLWYYSPMMAEWSVDALASRGVVYDCMDELSQFAGAPESMARNEALLLDRADVVFTGGPELYASKSQAHENVHCFGCGVEFDHFSRARAEGAIPDDVAALSRPIVGWFGVIDERFDYDLLRETAGLRPNVNFVMVGPVVKVDPAKLPQAHNLHWLGSRDYQQLPDYCRPFDICMMCFAINQATEYINPTKALEYLATGRPVIATPVRDVVRQYSDLMAIVDSPEAFAKAIDAAIANPDREAIQLGIEKAGSCSWETIVDQMRELVERAIRPRHAVAQGPETVIRTA